MSKKPVILFTLFILIFVILMFFQLTPIYAAWWNGSYPSINEQVSTDPIYPNDPDVQDITPATQRAKEDIRSTYTNIYNGNIWLRMYTEGDTGTGNIDYLFFIDTDNNSQTGGRPSIEGLTIGIPLYSLDYYYGYEYAVRLNGGSAYTLYKWNGSIWIDQNSTTYVRESGNNTIDPDDNKNHSYNQVYESLETINIKIGTTVKIFTRTWDSIKLWGDAMAGVGIQSGGKWQSYTSAAYTKEANYFPNNSNIYMDGEGFLFNALYKIAYYDGNNNLVSIESVTSSGIGDLAGSYHANTEGTWHAVVYNNANTPPATYTSTDTNIKADKTFVVDSTPPPPPNIKLPLTGTTTNVATVNLLGTAEANSQVSLYNNGVLLEIFNVNGSGSWEITTVSLSDGIHTFEAYAFDGLYNSTKSNTVTINIDTTAPPPPTISTPPNDTLTNDATVLVSGTAEPNSTINIYDIGTLIGTVTADVTGIWTFTTEALADGVHTFEGTSSDGLNTSGLSTPITITLITSTVNPPDITSPLTGTTTNDATPTIIGTAEANMTITVYDNGIALGTTISDGSGNWSYTTPTLSNTIHTIEADAYDGVNTSIKSNAVTLTVTAIIPNAPTIESPLTGTATNVAIIDLVGTAEASMDIRIYDNGSLLGSTTSNGSGDWNFTTPALSDGIHTLEAIANNGTNDSPGSNTITITVDTIAPPAPTIISPITGTTTNDSTPTFIGTAEANTTINIIDNGSLIGTVTADAVGDWTFTPTIPLSEGIHTFEVSSSDGLNVSTITIVILNIDTTTPPTPTIISPVTGTTTDEVVQIISGTAEADTTIRVYDDGIIIGSTTSDGSGNWSFITGILTNGLHTFEADSSDGVNTSGKGNKVELTVAAVIPATPVISSPITGLLTNDATVDLSGTAEASIDVRIYDNGSLLGSTTSDGSGNWSFPTVALPDGVHTFEAEAFNGTNPSYKSNPVTVTIDTIAPPAPTITQPPNGTTTNDATPTFVGTAEANTTINISDNGSLIGIVTAEADGDWTFTPTTPLSEGIHTIEVTSSDGINVSSITINIITIDTIPPPTPVITSPVTGSTTTEGEITLLGTAEANVTVRLYDIDILLGSTTADGSGNWSYNIPSLTVGTHTYEAEAFDGVNYSAKSNKVEIIRTVPQTVDIDNYPTGTTHLTNESNPAFNGYAPPNSVVEVFVDGVKVGTTLSDNNGNWTFTMPTIPDGPHTVEVTTTDNLGNPISSNVIQLTIDLMPPLAPYIASPLNGTATNSSSAVTLTGTAEANSILNMYDDTLLLGTTNVDSSGNWTFTTATLADGTHPFKATATDAFGNISAVSNIVAVNVGQQVNTITVTVDTTHPYITEVKFDNVDIISGDYVATNPTITALITDEGTSGIDPATIRIIIDEGTPQEKIITGLAGYYDATTNRLTYKFGAGDTLSEGSHTIKIDVANNSGNKASEATPSRAISEIVNVQTDIAIPKPVLSHPNPFNPSLGPAKIMYNLTKDTDIRLLIYNTNADLIWSKYISAGSPGAHVGYNEVTWDGIDAFARDAAPGVYLVHIVTIENGAFKLIGKTKIAVLR